MGANPVLTKLVGDRDELSKTIDNVLEAIANDEREPTESERELLKRHRDKLNELEPAIVELVDLEETRKAARDARGVLDANAPRNGDGSKIIRTAPPSSEPVYRTFAEFARDELIVRFAEIASRAGMGAKESAAERLTRSNDPTLTRAVANTISTDVPGLNVPQHLTQILEVIDRSRPIVEASRRTTLTSGTLTYPKITQRPIVAKQATEKTEVVSQKMTVAMQTVAAAVFAGAGDLSWQAINWTTPDALALFFDLMAEAYAQATEAETYAKLSAAGFTAGTAPADATFGAWYAALAVAAGQVYTSTGRPANSIVASIPDAFYMLGMVSPNAPKFGAAGTINLQGSGTVNGLQIIASRAVPAGALWVADMGALLTAEESGAPVQLRAVEPSLAGMEVGVVGGFVAERTAATAFVKLDVSLVNPTLAPEQQPAEAPKSEAPKSGNGK